MKKIILNLLLILSISSQTVAQKTGASNTFGGTPATAGTGSNAGAGSMARKLKGVLVHIGDSNTNGRPGWRTAYEAEWLQPGGLFEGWTSYNIGHNGSQLNAWATTDIASAESAPCLTAGPIDYNLTDPDSCQLARAINANPDIVILSLGTNDENNPSARATIGTEASLRANLATLVNYILRRTHASIILRMPQPFEPTDFSGITQWVDAAEAREASRRLRVVYREWIGRSDRVEVYDSHAALFGDYCDNRSTDAQDPWLGAGNPLIEDSLHPTGLGYRRIVQQIGQMLRPSHERNLTISRPPDDIARYAVWSTTLFARGSAIASGTSSTLGVDISQQSALAGQTFINTGLTFTGTPGARKQILDLPMQLGLLSSLQQLLNIPNKSLLYAYSHSTGATTAFTGLSLSTFVTASSPYYATLNVSSADLTGLGGGRVTFYTIDATNPPYRQPVVVSATLREAQRAFSHPLDTFTIKNGKATRQPSATTPVVTLYLANQGDGRYVSGSETFNAPGKPVGTFTFSAFQNNAAFVWDATNYPSGSLAITTEYLVAKVTTGAISDFTNSLVEIYLRDQ